MTKKEMDEFLESIGGLNNGFYPDREPIKSSGFFCVGDGWLQLIKDCIVLLIAAGWNKEICQVKEKFGSLRFYTNDLPDVGHEIIQQHEKLSMITCELCGKPGKISGQGWLKCRCIEHE